MPLNGEPARAVSARAALTFDGGQLGLELGAALLPGLSLRLLRRPFTEFAGAPASQVLEVQTRTVAGNYTLAAASIPTADLPEEVIRKLPRYPSLPAVLVGRLAVDLRFRRRGLGGALLADAAAKALRAEAAAFAMLVDARDEAAVAFYEHHGFERLESRRRSLFLALATAEKALAGAARQKTRGG